MRDSLQICIRDDDTNNIYIIIFFKQMFILENRTYKKYLTKPFGESREVSAYAS